MTRRISAKRLIAAIAGTFCILAGCVVAYQLTRARLSESILVKIDRLSLHPPKDMPELEWAILVYWTHNLHCASTPQTGLSLRELRRLDNDLSEMLGTEPNRESIDELWARYSSLTAGGAKYRAEFEPVRDSIIDAAAKDDAYFDRGSYTDFIAAVRMATDY
jgi:hypothetical protein